MRTTLIYCLAVAVVALTGVRAYAADPTPPRKYSMDEPVAYNWTGAYFGVHGGYADHEFTIGDKNTPDQEPASGLGGVQAGYLYQFQSGVVIGAELDASMGQARDSVKDGKSITQESSVDITGTVRGKLGYSFGRVLVYGTAGAAFEEASLSENCPKGVEYGHCSKTGAYTDKEKYTDVGLVYGGGVAIGIAEHVSAFAEYIREDYGNDKHDLGEHSSDREVDQNTGIVRGGLNYRF